MKTIDKYTGDGQINLDSNIKNAYGNSNNDSTWNRQESASAKKDQNCCSGCMQSFSNLVVGILERAFYR